MVEEHHDLDVQKLRRETEADHQAVEGAIPLMHEGLSQAEYVQCLARMHGVVAAWEERAAQVVPPWLQTTLNARRRTPLLERDLEWFGVTKLDTRRPALPEMSDHASFLGTMYVMEGSTLGGQFIARHVEATLNLNEGKGSSYFRGHGTQTGPMWKEFCEILKLRIPGEQTEAVIVSAKAMFNTFGNWMQQKSAIYGS